MTDIKGSVVLVTGGGRGLGKALVNEAVARGAAKVYATARDPRTVADLPGVVPLALEITDPASVAALVEQTRDVNILINNAGIYRAASVLTGDLNAFRDDFETNVFGSIAVSRAVVPNLLSNVATGSGGHVLNVASVLSWLAVSGSYSAAKAALWSLTNSMRLELADQGVGVSGLHVGYMDTDMAASVEVFKSDPADIARLALDGIQANTFEILADDLTRNVRAGLSGDVAGLYPQLAAS
jgi:NAD(P)-dependent dehydrogenase (short-subunit alcohol dehydrogenase family)